MRIRPLRSALQHGITNTEIRIVVNYPELRLRVASRLVDVETDSVLFVGRPTANELHLEVIADLFDPTEAVVFHAMMLRPSLAAELNLSSYITPDYAPQRRQTTA